VPGLTQGKRTLSDWEFVKTRTASGGTVWRSPDGLFYKHTGTAAVRAEAHHLQELAALGYPVPQVVTLGQDEAGQDYFVERSVGQASLHDQALADAQRTGQVGQQVLDATAAVSARLLTAQARNPLPSGPTRLRDWFDQAGFTDNVFAENPDLDTPRVHAVIAHATDRLAGVPMCRSHLDYGLPNAFDDGVIDWQHHGTAPLGYDVYPMLEIVPFKGGTKGYAFTADQRERYLAALDQTSLGLIGRPLRGFLGEFLLVKCFFFLALMRPTQDSRPEKDTKWRYRRTLFTQGLEQYESSGAIQTDAFPTLAAFTERLARTSAGGA
jgi:hypothetical protein